MYETELKVVVDTVYDFILGKKIIYRLITYVSDSLKDILAMQEESFVAFFTLCSILFIVTLDLIKL